MPFFYLTREVKIQHRGLRASCPKLRFRWRVGRHRTHTSCTSQQFVPSGFQRRRLEAHCTSSKHLPTYYDARCIKHRYFKLASKYRCSRHRCDDANSMACLMRMDILPPWRNRLARSAVNRKVGGSSPPGGGRNFCSSPHYLFFLLLLFFYMYLGNFIIS